MSASTLRASDIIGEGHGDAHLWVYENSNNTGHSFYHCARCPASFVHAYRATPDIFAAMQEKGVPLECRS